jgi:hypothetical protein
MEPSTRLRPMTSADGIIHPGASGGHLCSTGTPLLSSGEFLLGGDQHQLWQIPASHVPDQQVPNCLLWPLRLLEF